MNFGLKLCTFCNVFSAGKRLKSACTFGMTWIELTTTPDRMRYKSPYTSTRISDDRVDILK